MPDSMRQDYAVRLPRPLLVRERHDGSSSPPTPRPSSPPKAPRLLDRVRAAIRARHYSRRTEAAYVGWVRRFVVFHGKRHPGELGEAEITAARRSFA